MTQTNRHPDLYIYWTPIKTWIQILMTNTIPQDKVEFLHISSPLFCTFLIIMTISTAQYWLGVFREVESGWVLPTVSIPLHLVHKDYCQRWGSGQSIKKMITIHKNYHHLLKIQKKYHHFSKIHKNYYHFSGTITFGLSLRKNCANSVNRFRNIGSKFLLTFVTCLLKRYDSYIICQTSLKHCL